MFARLDFRRFLVCCSGDISDDESEEKPSVAICGGSICILTGLFIPTSGSIRSHDPERVYTPKLRTFWFVFSGDVYVAMKITFLTRKCPPVRFTLYVYRLSSLTLDYNGVFAINAYPRSPEFESKNEAGHASFSSVNRTYYMMDIQIPWNVKYSNS